MKIANEIKKEYGVVNSNSIREYIFSQISKRYTNSKYIKNIVEFCILSTYFRKDILNTDIYDLNKDIGYTIMCLQYGNELPKLLDKKTLKEIYIDIFYECIYATDEEMFEKLLNESDAFSKVHEVVNMIELGEWPKIALNQFDEMDIQKAIDDIYDYWLQDNIHYSQINF